MHRVVRVSLTRANGRQIPDRPADVSRFLIYPVARPQVAEAAQAQRPPGSNDQGPLAPLWQTKFIKEVRDGQRRVAEFREIINQAPQMDREPPHHQFTGVLHHHDLRTQLLYVIRDYPDEAVPAVVADVVLRQRPREDSARRTGGQHRDAAFRQAHGPADRSGVGHRQVGFDWADTEVGQVAGVTSERPASTARLADLSVRGAHDREARMCAKPVAHSPRTGEEINDVPLPSAGKHRSGHRHPPSQQTLLPAYVNERPAAPPSRILPGDNSHGGTTQAYALQAAGPTSSQRER